MKMIANALLCLPVISLSILPAAIASTRSFTEVSTGASPQLAQMTQLYCTVHAPSALLESPTYDAEAVGSVEDGDYVAFNIGNRDGDWAEITNGAGETGWLETAYLTCD